MPPVLGQWPHRLAMVEEEMQELQRVGILPVIGGKMNVAYLSSDDWEEFRKKYPDAYFFLLNASLRGEFTHLGMKDRRVMDGWDKRRLAELLEVFGPKQEGE